MTQSNCLLKYNSVEPLIIWIEIIPVMYHIGRYDNFFSQSLTNGLEELHIIAKGLSHLSQNEKNMKFFTSLAGNYALRIY